MDINNFTLADLPQIEQVYGVTEEDTCRTALGVLVERNVYSLAVFNNNKQYLGVVTLDAIVGSIAKLFAEKAPKNEKSYSQKIADHKYSNKEVKDITEEFDRITLKEANGEFNKSFSKSKKAVHLSLKINFENSNCLL